MNRIHPMTNVNETLRANIITSAYIARMLLHLFFSQSNMIAGCRRLQILYVSLSVICLWSFSFYRMYLFSVAFDGKLMPCTIR